MEKREKIKGGWKLSDAVMDSVFSPLFIMNILKEMKVDEKTLEVLKFLDAIIDECGYVTITKRTPFHKRIKKLIKEAKKNKKI